MTEASTLDFIMAVAPIVILIYLMVKRNSWPSYVALPFAALLVYGVKMIYFDADPNLTNATVIAGLLTAFTPIFIIWGAILLFKTMEHTGAMNTVRAWLNNITPNRVAQLMIIGWAFSFLIEGASGFGTPAALAAPILIGLGFAPLPVACLTLIMNSVPVTFGAVGTPTWFGLGQLGLPSEQLLDIGMKSAIIHSAAALVIPVIALAFVVTWREIRANIVFVYISILSCVVPYLAISYVNYEFPSLLGGMIGLIVSAFLAHRNIGLAPIAGVHERPEIKGLVKALFPIWGTVVVLILTRIPDLGLRGLMTATTPLFSASLGSLGEFSLTTALIIQLSSIFDTAASWQFQTLYIPAFIPFFLVSGISFLMFRSSAGTARAAWSETYGRMIRPIQALLGALVMVSLMRAGGADSLVIVIGQYFASGFGATWLYVASYLGAIGAFFSGSNTVSNLIFAGIQQSIAESADLNVNVILAMQSVGGAMGNMVSINNVVAVCSILGILNREGYIIIRTFGPMVLYGIIAGIIGAIMA